MMKKTLVAMAAVAATSSFAQVTLSGVFDLGYSSIDNKGAVVNTVGAQNGSTTSSFAMKADEDLGGGMKAGFQWEAAVDLGNTSGRNSTSGTPATGTTSNVTTYLGNGNSFLYLSGGFGTLKLGAPNLSTWLTNGIGQNGFGTGVGSGYRVTSFDSVRAQNGLRYESPVIAGFSGTFHTVVKNNLQSNADNTASGNNVNQLMGRDGLTEISFAFEGGPIAARYSALRMTQDAALNPAILSETTGAANGTYSATGVSSITAAGANFALDTLGASYQVTPATKASLFYQRAYSDSNLQKASAGTTGSSKKYDRVTTGVAVAYQVNPAFIVRANYQVLNTGETETFNTGSAQTTALGLGADYSLSKRTAVFARYEIDQDGVGARSTTGYTATSGNTTYTSAFMGIRHSF